MTRKIVNDILGIALFIVMLPWGITVMLQYYGEPGHASVLLSEAAKTDVASACPSLSPLCTGWNGMGPSIVYAVERLAPIASYALWSLVLYALFLGVRAAMSSDPLRRLRLRLWHIPALFALAVWLLFNVLAFSGGTEGLSMTQIVEPIPQVYPNASPEAMLALQENFLDLERRGCLTLLQQTPVGAGLYRIAGSCLETAFFTRVLPPMLTIALVLIVILVLGTTALRLVRLRPASMAIDALMASAVGSCLLIVLLWLLALLGVYTQAVGWVALCALPFACYRASLEWLRRLRDTQWEVRGEVWGIGVFLGWLLVSYLAFNYLHLIRPFPLGWDDLGSYMNRPRLLVSYGHAIPSIPVFQWEFITSLGFLLYGFGSSMGASVSMLMNWMAGIYAVAAIIVFVRTYLGRGGVLSALLYYTLPLVGHFSFADMKIDNALFFFIVSGLLALFLFLFAPHEDDASSTVGDLRWVGLSGVLFSFAFATKVTAIMAMLAALPVLLGALLGPLAFFGAALLSVVVYQSKGVLPLEQIADRLGSGSMLSPTFVLSFFLLAGAACLVIAAARRRAALRSTALSLLVFIGCFAAGVLPWLARNNLLHGNVIPRLELGVPNQYAPVFDIDGKRPDVAEVRTVLSLPKDLIVDRSHPACQPSSSSEELDRYWGDRTGWRHYLTLPWRSVMNIDSNGYYVITSPLLLLFPLLLLLPFFWLPAARWLRWLSAGTVLMVVQWMFLANGVPWYGIGMFLGLCIAVEALVVRAPDLPNRIFLVVLVVLGLVTSFSFRMWQFEQQRFLFEYTVGKVSDDVLRQRTILHYDDVATSITQRRISMPKRPYTYRIGTFIPYFVPQNLEAFPMADNQMDFFNCLYFDRDPQKMLARLKALGFNGIVFDTNTHTIEKDPNGSLHQKVAAFVDFVTAHPDLGITTVVADPDAGIAYFLLP